MDQKNRSLLRSQYPIKLMSHHHQQLLLHCPASSCVLHCPIHPQVTALRRSDCRQAHGPRATRALAAITHSQRTLPVAGLHSHAECAYTPGPSGVPGLRMPVQPPGVRTDALTHSIRAQMHVYASIRALLLKHSSPITEPGAHAARAAPPLPPPAPNGPACAAAWSDESGRRTRCDGM